MRSPVFNSFVEIDMSVIAENYRKVQSYIGDCKIIPVVKANAYGLGAVEIALLFQRLFSPDMVACSHVFEAAELRDGGVTCEILVMGGVYEEQLPIVVEGGIQIPVYTVEGALALARESVRQNKRTPFHIKIETGMNRIGIKPGEELEALLDTIAEHPEIELQGVFTHFATAGTPDDTYAYAQTALFEQALAQFDARGMRPKYVHSCSTPAVSWLKQAYGTHIRAGCALLGYPSMDDSSNPLGLTEPASWRCKVTRVHDINPGESCGYDRHYMAEKKTSVAAISIGFGDGIFRPLAQSYGPVILNETPTRFLATCMDQSMIDATDIPVKTGDIVTLFGVSPRGGASLSVNELAKYTDQNPTLPLVSLGRRVERVYINIPEHS